MQDNVRNLINTRESQAETAAASPQPRCPKCGSFNVTIGYCDSPTQLGVHSATCRVCRTSCDSTGTMWPQFFAAAPAQELDQWLEFGPNTPPRNGMYRVRISPKDKTTAEWMDGKWLWDACEGDPVTDLTSQVTHYKAAQEQPVENSTRFWEFDNEVHPFNKWWKEHGQFMMSGGGRREFIWACRGWIAREQLAEGVEVTGETEPSPQKGKP